MHCDHIHTADDWRGFRKVFVNGNEIDNVDYADTKRGIVWFAPEPVRVHRNGEDIYRRKLRGNVTVEFMQ